jgi:O-antigen ligase
VRRGAAFLLGLALTTLPALASACAVCGFGQGRNRDAFFWTMVLLSLLPLGMLGAGLMFLRHAARRRAAGVAVSADAPAPPPS